MILRLERVARVVEREQLPVTAGDSWDEHFEVKEIRSAQATVNAGKEPEATEALAQLVRHDKRWLFTEYGMMRLLELAYTCQRGRFKGLSESDTSAFRASAEESMDHLKSLSQALQFIGKQRTYPMEVLNREWIEVSRIAGDFMDACGTASSESLANLAGITVPDARKISDYVTHGSGPSRDRVARSILAGRLGLTVKPQRDSQSIRDLLNCLDEWRRNEQLLVD